MSCGLHLKNIGTARSSNPAVVNLDREERTYSRA